MITRGQHRCSPLKQLCERCALPADANHGQCPPGYWMTKEEIARWEGYTEFGRFHLEQALGANEVKK